MTRSPSLFAARPRAHAPGRDFASAAAVAVAVGVAAAAALTGPPAARAADLPPLIAREVLFGNPERANPQISPDGRRLAWLAPDKKDVLQVWVKTIGKDDDRAVTADPKRGIRMYFWAEDGRTLLYQQDADGDENWHVHGVDLDTGADRDLTPWRGVRAEALATHPRYPDVLLVTMNVRDKTLFDVYRVTLSTGAVALDTTNPGDVADWTVDDKLAVRGASVATPDGGTELRVRDAAPKAKWRTLLKAGPEEDLALLDFTKDGASVYLKTSLGSDTSRVVTRNLKTGAEKELARSFVVDAGAVVIHPTKHVVEAVGFVTGRNEWTVVDPTVKADYEALAKVTDGDFFLTNRDRDDKTWLVGYTRDRGPTRYYAWDRAAKKETFLFVTQPKLEGLALAEMKPIEVKARDGLVLHGYLTLPVGVAPAKLPTVLLVHGGPWGRDVWGMSSTVQWLANRGYAVVQVNFRGSTGYGKKFLHAGDKEWGLKMHDDLVDAVSWAVKEGVADPKRVAVYGGSYGGYSALAGAAFTPDTFRCAVDIVGPSNLFTLLASIPPYWKPLLGMFRARVGDPDDPKEKALLTRASPLFSAAKIKIPLLIGQGANDPRVKPAEAEQIVEAITKNKGKAVYVLYPDEGHGFARPENRIDFNARAEAFLAENLGGRAEPLKGDRYPGSTAVVKVVGGAAGGAGAGAAKPK
ncbi:MAG TPA: S9 family peptidase [Myxococcota bacterium]|jgi:dipeptidyl aminopeptidase/acylaminoacyl peptidase|nr:S9 family peptidase [Myxococcota bacterium]